jgi:acetolactate synthase regulatory subunit
MKILNTFQHKGFVVNQVRYDEATLGGHYAVEMTCNDINILTIDGLTLNTSIEAFKQEVNFLKRQLGV